MKIYLMSTKYNKERLFEIMSKVDKNFKIKLTEIDNQNHPIDADKDKITTPPKLYVGDHLTNTAKYFVDNVAHIHYFKGVNDTILAYAKPFKEEIIYELNSNKMLELGFKIENDEHPDMKQVWNITVPHNYSHNNTIRLIDKYMDKIIINFPDFAMLYDFETIDDYYKKFGKPTVPIQFINAPEPKQKLVGASHFDKNLINFNENNINEELKDDNYINWNVENVNNEPTLVLNSEKGGKCYIDFEWILTEPDELGYLKRPSELYNAKNDEYLTEYLDKYIPHFIKYYGDKCNWIY